MTFEEAQKYYNDKFPVEMTYDEISAEINKIKNSDGIEYIHEIFCNDILTIISRGFIRYYNTNFNKNNLITLFKNHMVKTTKENSFLWSVYYYFCNDFHESEIYLIKAIDNIFNIPDVNIDENIIVEYFLEPFKQGFQGFWNIVYKGLMKHKVSNDILDLCILLKSFYSTANNEHNIEELTIFIQKCPYFNIPKELLAVLYQDACLWKNSIACLESIKEPLVLYKDEVFFMLGWAHGKCKELKQSETYYRKCLDIFPERKDVMNNLAYTLYLQKKYTEAKAILEKCLKENRDLPYSANNYIRVLIALEEYDYAEKFINSNKYKIDKNLKERVQKLRNKKVLKKANGTKLNDEAVFKPKNYTVNYQQFSNEKILEDELVARIENGNSVFGLDLKIYRRYGAYGRQYTIPIGRLDLLCEDSKGDLYIIELKKDAGYDDVYKQISAYIDWFDKNEISKGKKVYGIICLNSPSKELIEKVHANKRVKIFEYKISYTEI